LLLNGAGEAQVASGGTAMMKTMRATARHRHRAALGSLAAAGLVLAACSSGGGPRPTAGVTPVAPAAPPPREEAILDGPGEAATAEMIWSLRGGLNVAALQCGNRSLADSYNEILRKHRSILNEAYAAEQARYGRLHGRAGVARHDADMTRLYNRFANLPNRARYCGDAARLAAELLSLPSDRLPAVARRALARLDPTAPAIVNAAR
jgi:hypothetical protein